MNAWVGFNEQEAKADFARALLRDPRHPLPVAISVVGERDMARAIEISRDWPNDAIVKKIQKELIKEFGESYFLPSKEDLARDVYEITRENKATVNEKLAAFRLYADIRGFIEKQAMNNIQNNTIVQNRVMIMPDYGSDDNWEEKLVTQQAKLIEHVKE